MAAVYHLDRCRTDGCDLSAYQGLETKGIVTFANFDSADIVCRKLVMVQW